MIRHDSLDDVLRSYFRREVAATRTPNRPQSPVGDSERRLDSLGRDGAARPDSGTSRFPSRDDTPSVAPKPSAADVWVKVLFAAAAALLIFLPLRGADLSGAPSREFAELHRRVDTGAAISSTLMSAHRVLRTRFATNGSADNTNQPGGVLP